jgi:hypothetical protein
MSHKLTWVATTSTAARRERRGCGGSLRGVTVMKSKFSAALGLSLLAFTFTSTPSYAITISVTPGATTSSVAGAVLFENFDGSSNASIGTVTGGTINEFLSTNPIPSDPLNKYVVADPTVTVTLTQPASYVGFLVGTADDPNTVTVLDGAQTLAQFSMTSLLPSLTGGSLTSPQVRAR